MNNGLLVPHNLGKLGTFVFGLMHLLPESSDDWLVLVKNISALLYARKSGSVSLAAALQDMKF
ncbi:hypothetical protein FRC03_002343 [Tulasnella sp. 419]|nr:hypothetical protein FRC03_002343 [Tulasnella sp. 419]